MEVVETPPPTPVGDGGLYSAEDLDPEAMSWPEDADLVEEEAAPLPIDDEDEGAAEAETPPPLVGTEPTPQDRFDAFRRWLKAGGISFDVWADQSALLRIAPPVVRIAFPSAFTSSQAKQRAEHPRIRAGVAAYFPHCVRAEVNIRPQKEGFKTWEEREAEARELRREEVRKRLHQDPDVQQIMELLGGELQAVLLEDEGERKQ